MVGKGTNTLVIFKEENTRGGKKSRGVGKGGSGLECVEETARPT